jgi:hypothetical protein
VLNSTLCCKRDQRFYCKVPPYPISEVVEFDVTFEGRKISDSSLKFVFYTQPKVGSLYPTTGRQQGQTIVQIFGEDFAPTDQFGRLLCKFGGSITYGIFVNSTTINCSSPRHDPGDVTVQVSNDNGTQWSDQAVTFEYYRKMKFLCYIPIPIHTPTHH